VAFDPDAPGESGTKKPSGILSVHGVEVSTASMRADLNSWFHEG
jgi:hypothetical protein